MKEYLLHGKIFVGIDAKFLYCKIDEINRSHLYITYSPFAHT